MLRLHTENQLSSLPGSASKVCVVVLVGGGWVESEFSDRLWLSFSLALAKPNKKAYSSVKDNDARWPDKNLVDIAPKALIDTHEEDEYSHLIIAAPTVDISNLDVTKLTPSDNVEVYKQKVIKSCENVFTWKKNFYFF